MASKRLTNSIKRDIAEIVINKTFADRIEAQGKKEREIFHKLVDLKLPPDFADIVKGREDWFTYVNSARVINERGDLRHTFDGWARKVPEYLNESRYYDRIIVRLEEIPADVMADIESFVAEQKAIRDEEKDLNAKLNEILNSVSTFKRLKELWPEVETYYKLDDNLMYPVATFNPADLNAMINQCKRAA